MENFLEKRSITVEQNEDVKYFYVKSQIFLITKTSILSDHENVVFDLFISYFRRYKKRVWGYVRGFSLFLKMIAFLEKTGVLFKQFSYDRFISKD